jgi:hypothetical protein
MPQIHVADTRPIRVRAARGGAAFPCLNLVLYAVEVLLTAPRVIEVVVGRGDQPRRALPSRELGSDAAAVAIAEGHVLKTRRLVSDQKPIGLERVWGWPV